MIRKPRFRSDLEVQLIPPDLLVLTGESDHHAFRGDLFLSLAPLIDGTHTVSDIVDALREQAPLPDVHFGLSLLEDGRVLVEGDDPRPVRQIVFGDALGLTADSYLERLQSAGVSVRSCGSVATRPLETLLEEAGVRLGEGDFEVLVVDDYLRGELAEVNRQALARSRPWMLVKPVGEVLWIGPIFKPGDSACWTCLSRRLRQNRPLFDYVEMHGGSLREPLQPSATSLPSMEQTAFSLAATEVLRWILGEGGGRLEGHLVTLDTATLALERHKVVRLEDCPECGQPPVAKGMEETRPTLENRPKLFLNDGGYRTILPESTLARFGHHISPLTGIVDGIRRVHEDSFLQVYMSAYSFPPRLKDRSFLEKGLRARSTGKGIHSSQARASALSEALERYSGVFRGDEPVHRATYASLGDAAVHPNDCMLFSQSQYEQREVWNQRERDFNWVPEPFRSDTEIDWTPVWSLTGDRVRFVPTAYCYYGYPVPADHDLCRADSNGNAAGNTLEEAILQGFMEVVERDSVALWWYNHGRRPAVDLDSFSQPYFGALRDYYRSLGRELWVLDLTHDFGIPSVASVSTSDAEIHLDDLLLGFGAHFDPAIAICRALTEMNQFLPSAMAGRTLRVAEGDLGDVAFLSPDPSREVRRKHDFSVVWNDDLLEDVLDCVRIAEERGLEVLMLDQTRAEVGMPVVKIIVPGMYPFWARFAPGRLYTVPSELGWVEGMTPEPKLNGAHIKI